MACEAGAAAADSAVCGAGPPRVVGPPMLLESPGAAGVSVPAVPATERPLRPPEAPVLPISACRRVG
ncbi:hypothetical protein ADK59_19325 [Streptomyces sp. XY332]|nr:hypothetical protein ADK59_19325 [Streptomyces sp. XY332]